MTNATDNTGVVTGAGMNSAWMRRNFELVIALLLGIASIVTAWASFQASLYDGEMAAANTQAGVLSAEAESSYLEGNQQYLRDGQLFDRLTELQVQMESSDPAAATVASQTIDILSFQSVTDDFSAAMDWAEGENDADPEMFTHPQGNEQYLEALFGQYETIKAEADAQLVNSAQFNDLGDQLTLNTVLLAISLFLLGIAAILRTHRTRVLIAALSTAVMVAATIMTIVVVSTPVA